MRTYYLKFFAIVVLIATISAACAPLDLHTSNDLVENGTIHVEQDNAQVLRVTGVRAYADVDGLHIIGELKRKRHVDQEGYIGVTLLDKNNKVLYQGKSSIHHWVSPTSTKNISVHSESFHLIISVSVPEQGTLRVSYNAGS
ncbi:MAG: hypothetical protein HQL94_03535 [Magnetococcales bacterium]|nr:hypothetical protein [Magnetococcales bacterium]